MQVHAPLLPSFVSNLSGMQWLTSYVYESVFSLCNKLVIDGIYTPSQGVLKKFIPAIYLIESSGLCISSSKNNLSFRISLNMNKMILKDSLHLIHCDSCWLVSYYFRISFDIYHKIYLFNILLKICPFYASPFPLCLFL